MEHANAATQLHLVDRHDKICTTITSMERVQQHQCSARKEKKGEWRNTSVPSETVVRQCGPKPIDTTSSSVVWKFIANHQSTIWRGGEVISLAFIINWAAVGKVQQLVVGFSFGGKTCFHLAQRTSRCSSSSNSSSHVHHHLSKLIPSDCPTSRAVVMAKETPLPTQTWK